MRRFNAAPNLDGNADRFFVRKLAFFLDIRFERNAFYIFHYNIVKAFFAAHVYLFAWYCTL